MQRTQLAIISVFNIYNIFVRNLNFIEDTTKQSKDYKRKKAKEGKKERKKHRKKERIKELNRERRKK